jgi:hypothetical protein
MSENRKCLLNLGNIFKVKLENYSKVSALILFHTQTDRHDVEVKCEYCHSEQKA